MLHINIAGVEGLAVSEILMQIWVTLFVMRGLPVIDAFRWSVINYNGGLCPGRRRARRTQTRCIVYHVVSMCN